jgi:hypothetical protein
MKKNILKSIFYFDRFNLDHYRKVVNRKNGIDEKTENLKSIMDWQLFVLKITVLSFLILLIILSVSTICFIKE